MKTKQKKPNREEILKKSKKALIFGLLLLIIGIIGALTGFLNFKIVPWHEYYWSIVLILLGSVTVLISLFYVISSRKK